MWERKNWVGMTRNDIIMFALPLWDGPFYSTALSLSKELARDNRVFYIDNPFTLKDVLTGFRNQLIRKRLPALLLGQRRFRAIDPSLPNLIAVTPGFVLP